MTEEEFYGRHPDHWERGVYNLEVWLGQPLTTLDLSILVTLLPLAALILVAGFSIRPGSGSRSLWDGIPKLIVGPYLLYGALALWHFHARWLWVLSVAAIGIVLCVIALKNTHDRRKGSR